MKDFKYDIVELIQAVRDRPCLWDKTIEVYKDRFERRKAWEEIFSLLDEEYDSMSKEDKRMTGEVVLHKWTNIRDTFVKSLRPRMGKTRRKYVLHDHLTFLCKTINIDPEESIQLSFMKEEQASEEESLPKKRSKREQSDDSTYEPTTSRNDSSRRRSKKSMNDIIIKETEVSGNDIDFMDIGEISASAEHNRLMNEDEAFFASLLPTVVKYNEDERLEFRIEVLNLMKKIKENRRWHDVEIRET